MSSDSRFRLILKGVHTVEAFKFTSWPGEFTLPLGLSWDESEKLRFACYKKGRLESVDWQALAKKLESTEDYKISNATITETGITKITLHLNLMDSRNHDYPEIRISADSLRIFISADQELNLNEFLALGETYWNNFAQCSAHSD